MGDFYHTLKLLYSSIFWSYYRCYSFCTLPSLSLLPHNIYDLVSNWLYDLVSNSCKRPQGLLLVVHRSLSTVAILCTSHPVLKRTTDTCKMNYLHVPWACPHNGSDHSLTSIVLVGYIHSTVIRLHNTVQLRVNICACKQAYSNINWWSWVIPHCKYALQYIYACGFMAHACKPYLCCHSLIMTFQGRWDYIHVYSTLVKERRERHPPHQPIHVQSMPLYFLGPELWYSHSTFYPSWHRCCATSYCYRATSMWILGPSSIQIKAILMERNGWEWYITGLYPTHTT